MALSYSLPLACPGPFAERWGPDRIEQLTGPVAFTSATSASVAAEPCIAPFVLAKLERPSSLF